MSAEVIGDYPGIRVEEDELRCIRDGDKYGLHTVATAANAFRIAYPPDQRNTSFSSHVITIWGGGSDAPSIGSLPC